ncbi:hypothetical protein CBR_g16926 [Chara braunii]|uniref:Uncharacterized protein n=1 Tax=Chara braunii TaxID=69332 RepID=A0A388KU42_CHABU|nr:hypothetical protein CBR_g16926 [Chara braunii]|eukprot:GBG73584.1 hypothetical protein CBR_g16926 [Chara braunii]
MTFPSRLTSSRSGPLPGPPNAGAGGEASGRSTIASKGGGSSWLSIPLPPRLRHVRSHSFSSRPSTGSLKDTSSLTSAPVPAADTVDHKSTKKVCGSGISASNKASQRISHNVTVVSSATRSGSSQGGSTEGGRSRLYTPRRSSGGLVGGTPSGGRRSSGRLSGTPVKRGSGITGTTSLSPERSGDGGPSASNCSLRANYGSQTTSTTVVAESSCTSLTASDCGNAATSNRCRGPLRSRNLNGNERNATAVTGSMSKANRMGALPCESGTSSGLHSQKREHGLESGGEEVQSPLKGYHHMWKGGSGGYGGSSRQHTVGGPNRMPRAVLGNAHKESAATPGAKQLSSAGGKQQSSAAATPSGRVRSGSFLFDRLARATRAVGRKASGQEEMGTSLSSGGRSSERSSRMALSNASSPTRRDLPLSKPPAVDVKEAQVDREVQGMRDFVSDSETMSASGAGLVAEGPERDSNPAVAASLQPPGWEEGGEKGEQEECEVENNNNNEGQGVRTEAKVEDVEGAVNPLPDESESPELKMKKREGGVAGGIGRREDFDIDLDDAENWRRKSAIFRSGTPSKWLQDTPSIMQKSQGIPDEPQTPLVLTNGSLVTLYSNDQRLAAIHQNGRTFKDSEAWKVVPSQGSAASNTVDHSRGNSRVRGDGNEEGLVEGPVVLVNCKRPERKLEVSIWALCSTTNSLLKRLQGKATCAEQVPSLQRQVQNLRDMIREEREQHDAEMMHAVADKANAEDTIVLLQSKVEELQVQQQLAVAEIMPSSACHQIDPAETAEMQMKVEAAEKEVAELRRRLHALVGRDDPYDVLSCDERSDISDLERRLLDMERENRGLRSRISLLEEKSSQAKALSEAWACKKAVDAEIEAFLKSRGVQMAVLEEKGLEVMMSQAAAGGQVKGNVNGCNPSNGQHNFGGRQGWREAVGLPGGRERTRFDPRKSLEWKADVGHDATGGENTVDPSAHGQTTGCEEACMTELCEERKCGGFPSTGEAEASCPEVVKKHCGSLASSRGRDEALGHQDEEDEFSLDVLSDIRRAGRSSSPGISSEVLLAQHLVPDGKTHTGQEKDPGAGARFPTPLKDLGKEMFPSTDAKMTGGTDLGPSCLVRRAASVTTRTFEVKQEGAAFAKASPSKMKKESGDKKWDVEDIPECSEDTTLLEKSGFASDQTEGMSSPTTHQLRVIKAFLANDISRDEFRAATAAAAAKASRKCQVRSTTVTPAKGLDAPSCGGRYAEPCAETSPQMDTVDMFPGYGSDDVRLSGMTPMQYGEAREENGNNEEEGTSSPRHGFIFSSETDEDVEVFNAGVTDGKLIVNSSSLPVEGECGPQAVLPGAFGSAQCSPGSDRQGETGDKEGDRKGNGGMPLLVADWSLRRRQAMEEKIDSVLSRGVGGGVREGFPSKPAVHQHQQQGACSEIPSARTIGTRSEGPRFANERHKHAHSAVVSARHTVREDSNRTARAAALRGGDTSSDLTSSRRSLLSSAGTPGHPPSRQRLALLTGEGRKLKEADGTGGGPSVTLSSPAKRTSGKEPEELSSRREKSTLERKEEMAEGSGKSGRKKRTNEEVRRGKDSSHGDEEEDAEFRDGMLMRARMASHGKVELWREDSNENGLIRSHPDHRESGGSTVGGDYRVFDGVDRKNKMKMQIVSTVEIRKGGKNREKGRSSSKGSKSRTRRERFFEVSTTPEDTEDELGRVVGKLAELEARAARAAGMLEKGVTIPHGRARKGSVDLLHNGAERDNECNLEGAVERDTVHHGRKAQAAVADGVGAGFGVTAQNPQERVGSTPMTLAVQHEEERRGQGDTAHQDSQAGRDGGFGCKRELTRERGCTTGELT